MFFARASNHDHGKGFTTAVNDTDQGESMRPVLAIDHREIKILADCADQIQQIAWICEPSGSGPPVSNRT